MPASLLAGRNVFALAVQHEAAFSVFTSWAGLVVMYSWLTFITLAADLVSHPFPAKSLGCDRLVMVMMPRSLGGSVFQYE